jgi:ArsR family transcriptional regulator, arsenate/arsenite/antimonite-responsive transcriptional repressor
MYICGYANIREKRTYDMEQLLQFFKGLSDETRLRIMLLLTQGELCVCDLMFVLDEPQSKVSRHLAYLKYSGLTKSKRAGVWMHYLLREPADDIQKIEIEFLKEKLAHLPEFRADREKLLELKKQGGCKAMLKFKAAHSFKPHTARTKHVPLA